MTVKTTHDLAREWLSQPEVPLSTDGTPMKLIIQTYRNYWRGDTKKVMDVTNFIKDGDEWLCTHGGWSGETKDGDELTLHHYCGSVKYDHYEEYQTQTWEEDDPITW